MQEDEQQACKQSHQPASGINGTFGDSPGQVLTLCVGGTLYTTTLGTLTAVPGSYLAILFGDSLWQPSSLLPGSQTPFIDRDGDLFRYVLAYLRFVRNCSCEHQQQLMLPDSPMQLQQLKAEADFYGLPGKSWLQIPSQWHFPGSSRNQQQLLLCMHMHMCSVHYRVRTSVPATAY
jgi:hypothetical protein